MGWRFRKSVKIAPGVRVNIGGKGLSYTLGRPGLSVNFGRRGTFANVGIPGTGLSYRQKIGTAAGASATNPMPATLSALPPAASPSTGGRSLGGYVVALALSGIVAALVTQLRGPAVRDDLQQPTASRRIAPDVPNAEPLTEGTRARYQINEVPLGTARPFHETNRNAASIASLYRSDPSAAYREIRSMVRRGDAKDAYLVAESIMSRQSTRDPTLRTIADEAFSKFMESNAQ